MPDDPRAMSRAMPWVFVLIWSTGFVVARYAMPHAPPLSFLSVRYVLSIAAFGVWIVIARPAWPRDRAQWGHLAASGVMMHAGYLGGVWAAVKSGIGAGTVALLVGLQPVLTAIWLSARSSRDGASRVTGQQWAGLLLGLVGLALVVWRKLGIGEVTPFNLACALLALLSITAGTLYQKRHVRPVDVRTGSLVQLGAALLVTLPLALLEPQAVQWHPDLVIALVWSVLALSLGASSLLMLLIQAGAATRVTSLFYLVPPCTAVLAWLLFDERLGLSAAGGMALCAIGVALVLRGERKPA